MNRTHNRVGIALGSGASRGWSHIGIIRALSEIGIEPDIICGCSIGALVGASYVANNLNNLEKWALSLTKLEVAKFFELKLSLNGFINTARLHTLLNESVCKESVTIESLTKTYAAVAADLETGREIWLTKGKVTEAVWASMSLPGLFAPIQNEGRWLVDGGLVNPVPVSVCRALGADIVIAVNLNGDIVGKHFYKKSKVGKDDNSPKSFSKTIREFSASLFKSSQSNNIPPGLFDTVASSFNITQDRITRSRMAGDPPDLVLAPKLSHIGLLEFYRASDAIQEGKECVSRMSSEIHHVLDIV